MSKYSRTAALLIATGVVAATAFAVPENAKEDYGFWLGNLNISPYIQGGYIHDDNANNARKQKKDRMDVNSQKHDSSDGYFIRPGFNLLLPGPDWRVAGNAYYDAARYSADGVDDVDNWGETLGFNGETDGGLSWRLTETIRLIDLEENYANFTDPSLRYSTRDRTDMNYGGTISKQVTERSSFDIGATYGKTDYDSELMYDSDRWSIPVGYAHKLTERTDWTLRFRHSESTQKSNNGTSLVDKTTKDNAATIGIKSRRTERLTYDISGGIDWHQGYKKANGSSNDKTKFTYTVGANWKGDERLTLRIYGLGQYETAEDLNNNEVDAKSIGVSASYRIFQRWKLSVGARYRREEYDRKVAKGVTPYGSPYVTDDRGTKRKDDLIDLNATLSYTLTDFASIYASYNYSETSSSIDDFDFDRNRFRIGGMLRY